MCVGTVCRADYATIGVSAEGAGLCGLLSPVRQPHKSLILCNVRVLHVSLVFAGYDCVDCELCAACALRLRMCFWFSSLYTLYINEVFMCKLEDLRRSNELQVGAQQHSVWVFTSACHLERVYKACTPIPMSHSVI
jgi:hypothetical protein